MQENHPIILILERWPNRRAIASDVGRPPVVIHRWFQRKSIPAKYDAMLLDGASRRNIPLNWRELMDARTSATDQDGHGDAEIQGASQ